MAQLSLLRAQLLLGSGLRHVFEIDDEILGQLEQRLASGMHHEQAVQEWLGLPATHSPVSVRIWGNRSDGTSVVVELHCEAGTRKRPPQSRQADLSVQSESGQPANQK